MLRSALIVVLAIFSGSVFAGECLTLEKIDDYTWAFVNNCGRDINVKYCNDCSSGRYFMNTVPANQTVGAGSGSISYWYCPDGSVPTGDPPDRCSQASDDKIARFCDLSGSGKECCLYCYASDRSGSAPCGCLYGSLERLCDTMKEAADRGGNLGDEGRMYLEQCDAAGFYR